MPNDLVKNPSAAGTIDKGKEGQSLYISENLSISYVFKSAFPASCEVGRERSGDYEMHIYFDNGEQVGCWSAYRDGTQEGEILSHEDAASVRRWVSLEKKIRKLFRPQK